MIGFAFRERARRLVEQHHSGLSGKHASDGDQLLNVDRKITKNRSRVHVHVKQVHNFACVASNGRPVDHAGKEPPVGKGPKKDVLPHRQVSSYSEFLFNQPDSRRHRVGWAVKQDRFAIDGDRPCAGLNVPRKDFHQRGLAGAIFSRECENLSRFEGEIDLRERKHPGILLRNP